MGHAGLRARDPSEQQAIRQAAHAGRFSNDLGSRTTFGGAQLRLNAGERKPFRDTARERTVYEQDK